MHYDIAIIGAGPGGYVSAIYGCLTLIKNKKPPKALMGLFFCQIYQIYLAECCGMCYDISNTRGGCL